METIIFQSIFTLSIVVPVVTEVIKTKWLGAAPKWTNQCMSWFVSMVLCVVGYLLKLGVFAEYNLTNTLIAGVMVGLISNGIFDIDAIQKALKKHIK